MTINILDFVSFTMTSSTCFLFSSNSIYYIHSYLFLNLHLWITHLYYFFLTYLYFNFNLIPHILFDCCILIFSTFNQIYLSILLLSLILIRSSFTTSCINYSLTLKRYPTYRMFHSGLYILLTIYRLFTIILYYVLYTQINHGSIYLFLIHLTLFH